MYFERDADELNKIMSIINKAYKEFYLNGYWEKRAREFYGEKYGIVRENLFKTYELEE